MEILVKMKVKACVSSLGSVCPHWEAKLSTNDIKGQQIGNGASCP